MSTEEDVEVEAEEVVEGEDLIEEPVQVKYYQAETVEGSGADEAGKEREEVARSSGVIEIPVMGVSESDVEIEAEEVGPEDRTDQQVTDIAEDQTPASGRPKTSTQASLDDVVEIPVEYEESLTEPPVSESQEAPKPSSGGLIEVAVVQLSEAEEPKPPAEPVSEPEPVDESRRISVHLAPAPRGLVEIPVQTASEPEPVAPEPEPVAPEPEPAAPEPSTPAQKEPTSPTRKISKKQPPSKTPSVDKSEPTSPTKKVSTGFKAGSKTPSVDRSEADDKSTASSAASKKSSVSTPAPAPAYKEVTVEQEAPTPAVVEEEVVKKKSSVTKPGEYMEVKIEQESAAAAAPTAPIPEEPVVPEAEPEPEVIKKPSTTFMEVPISMEEEKPAGEPTARLIDIPVGVEPSPPRRSPPRRAKEPIEPYIAAQLEQAPKVRLPPRSSSYVTYASWAPAEFNAPPFVPHSAFVARAPKYRNEHTATYKYVPPALNYLNEFDDYVKVGSFSKNLWAEDRAFRRSRSLDRRRPIGGYATSQFGPPALRRAGSTSLPTSTAPSRSTSFTNLMDYVVATNNDLRRSRSRSRLEAEAEYCLSRTASRGHVVSSELLNYEPDPFERQAYTTFNYVRRLHEPYESTVDSYYGRYSGRPYGPYAGATHYDHLYPRDDYSTRRIRRLAPDQYMPSSRNIVEQDNPLFVSRNLRDSVQNMERRYRAYPQYNVHESYGWKPRTYAYPFP